MNYSYMKVKDAMEKISKNEIYLPAIQRKFVWGPERIEKLFDSIMRGYPIGTFLFWFVEGETKNDYTFYKFIQDYHQRDKAVNEVAPKPHLRDKFIGVLDGQQRLNSMYVALQGSYAYKRKHGHWNNPASFPQRWMYLNLLYDFSEDDEAEVEYQLAFLTKEQAARADAGQLWFLVKDVLNWKGVSDVYSFTNDLARKHPEHAARLTSRGAENLTTLWQRLCLEDVISYFKVQGKTLDTIVDIFIRVNSAGVQLSKTDLLFSSIVAHWDEGRAQIEAAIAALNEKGSGFKFDNDFVMRSCLALADLPMRLKVASFKKENIERIKTLWPQIREALETSVDLLVEWGFSRETLPALNAVIPIAYFVLKGGDADGSSDALRQYLLRAQLNQIFRSKTDRVLGAIRDNLRVSSPEQRGVAVLRSPQLTVDVVVRMTLPDDRTLRITDKDLEEYLQEKKGPYTFMLLSLLYPHLKFNQIQFHQDHLHPASQFSKGKLKNLGLDDEEIARWQDDRDRLPNLQLLEGAENKSKNATPLETWVANLSPMERDHFVNTNCLPVGASLGFAEFERFYAARASLLHQKLEAILVS